ncbi:EAL domain-containing protein [Marinobacter lipolyticus]|uniref:EAL domain-containing protein n=1 Tax=Marinobacter lipolyticus TaxID=209639 RepID=UPI002B1CC7A2|nr:EAL domain-containing protein [Marinobacter lipolyticus]
MRHIALFFALMGAMITMAPYGHADSTASSRLPQPPIAFLKAPADADLSALLKRPDWQTLAEDTPNFGYVTDNFWYRLPLDNHPRQQVLEISYPQLDDVSFYLLANGTPIKKVVTGDHLAFSERPLYHPSFLIPYTVEPGVDYEIVLSVQTNGAHQVPIRLWEQNALFDALTTEDRLHSLYYGILITTIFFNLFIFLTLREATYLFYVLSTFGYLFLLAALRGVTYQVFWPESPWLQNQTMLMAVPVALLFALLFARSFLRLRDRAPRTDMLLKGIIGLSLAAVLGTFVLDFNTSIKSSVALALSGFLVLTVIGPVQWVKRNPQAGYYTVAWALLIIGTMLTAANKYGLLPTNWLTSYGMQVGSGLEAILLTIALAKRLYNEREEKLHAREAELRAMAARRSAELRFMDQALHNPLTGLPNRTSFEMMINDLITRVPDRRYAIAVIHLSNLQAITKTLGHRNTDRLIELASARFNSIVRELPGILPIETTEQRSVYLASLEPATFGFVVDASLIGAAPRAIVQGLEELREPVDYLGMQLPLDPQIGTAIYPEHAQDTNSLIRRAHIAQGSDEARDRGLAYYQPTRDSYSADRLTLVSELRKALQNGELELHLQPKLALTTRTIVGVEALIRWPQRKIPIRADVLIGIAEQTGLIKPLTRWVLEQSLEIRSRLVEQGWPLDISVNISPNNLREPDFPMFVQRLMNSHHNHRGAITLEVTETSMMQDPANSLKALNSLHSAGIPLSIDDFGSGYSSLSYIKQLPANEIKIDRSLITDIGTHHGDRVIVQTTIDMCHSLGYKVVAEGVEDDNTAELLEGMGCDMIQGYLLTPPLPFDELVTWLSNQSGAGVTRKIV